jgi:hypothetical protein
MSAADAIDPEYIAPTFSAAAAIAVETRLTRMVVLLSPLLSPHFRPAALAQTFCELDMLWAAPAAFMSKIISIEELRAWSKTCAIIDDCGMNFASSVPTVISLSNSKLDDANM